MFKENIAVLDIDGTLTDSIVQHQKAFERALISFGFPALRTDWSAYRHHSDSGIFAEAWEDARWQHAPDLKRLEESFIEAFDTEIGIAPLLPITGAPEFLIALERSSWIPVFATGSLRHGALRKLACLNVDYDADLLVTASDYVTREDIVSNAIERAKVKHGISGVDRIVSIGDGIWDIKTARNLGLEFLGIGFGEKGEKLRAEGARVHEGFGDGLAMFSNLPRI